MKAFCVALVSAGIGASLPAAAQETAPPRKSVQLTKVRFDTETHPIKARVKGGTACVFASHIDLPQLKKTQDSERFDALFSTEMKSQGYSVVSTSGDLFADESGQKGELLIGAVVEPVNINVCSSFKGMKGSIAAKVHWQVYDRASQKVVDTADTEGTGTVAAFGVNAFDEMWNLAFVEALKNLAEGPVMQKDARFLP